MARQAALVQHKGRGSRRRLGNRTCLSVVWTDRPDDVWTKKTSRPRLDGAVETTSGRAFSRRHLTSARLDMSVPRSVWTDRPDDVWTGSLSRCRLNGACLDKHPSRRRLDGAVQAASVHAPPPLHTQTPPSGRLSLGFTQAGSVWWESWFYPFSALLFCSHSVSPPYPPPDRAHVMSCGRSVIIITAVQYMNRPSAAATWAAITQPVSPCGSRSIFDSKYGVQIASKKSIKKYTSKLLDSCYNKNRAV